MKRFWTYILAGAISVSVALPAMAKDHDRDHHTSREWREHHDRDNHVRRTKWNDHDRDDHKGWDKGRKTGWHGGSQPPGLAKKHRDNDHDRDDWARNRRRHHHHTTYAHNRAPVVTPRGTNYPARTYPTQTTQHGRGPIPVPSVGAQPTTTAQKPSGRGPIVVPGR